MLAWALKLNVNKKNKNMNKTQINYGFYNNSNLRIYNKYIIISHKVNQQLTRIVVIIHAAIKKEQALQRLQQALLMLQQLIGVKIKKDFLIIPY